MLELEQRQEQEKLELEREFKVSLIRLKKRKEQAKFELLQKQQDFLELTKAKYKQIDEQRLITEGQAEEIGELDQKIEK